MLDAFGRPEPPCCQGNIYAVQGKAPWKATTAESAAAMGIDRDHMSYDRLAQSLPPSYTRMVVGQMCMQIASDRYGAPAISYDEHVADPARTSRALAGWLRGSGDDSAAAGLAFVAANEAAHEPVRAASAHHQPP